MPIIYGSWEIGPPALLLCYNVVTLHVNLTNDNNDVAQYKNDTI